MRRTFFTIHPIFITKQLQRVHFLSNQPIDCMFHKHKKQGNTVETIEL